MHACVYKLHEFWRKRLYHRLLGIFCLVSVIKFQDVIKMQPHFDKINFLTNFKAIGISLSGSSFSATFEPKKQASKQWNTFNYSSIMRITPRDFSAWASPESSLSSQCESFEIRSPFVSNSSAVWDCDII